ncbi:ATP-binding protein [Saccharibacillus sp. CPCC 101409]|uniref:ATP-binding protein n=1 Tax=Saccharibacillus sp. CPCC 101409 TaxID=3058041 RepID=UPI002673A365|nr:ATP-binding protein [Saccharibacillus sp. CPCC 101409]MDO3410030.1 ATP-binding protein [Saccharibacillus sp. CPCC 101409]
MWKKGLELLLGAFLIMIVPGVGLMNMWNSQRDLPQAEAGVIDLGGWNYERSGPVSLNGEWIFYPGRLLGPDDFAENAPESLTAAVPGAWNRAMPDGPLGSGTYRLTVLLGRSVDEDYGLRIANVRMASRVYLNGEEIGASGTPAASVSEGVQKNIPYTGFTRVRGDRAELIVQASNFSYSSGGIISPVQFGPENVILHDNQGDVIRDVAMLGGFLMPGVLCLLLYGLHKRELPQLFLGLFCLMGTIYVLTHGEKLIDFFLPDLSYMAVLKLQAASSNLIYLFLIAYMAALSPGAVRRAVLTAYIAVTAVGTAAVLILPMALVSRADGLIPLISFASIVYVCLVISKWARRQPEDLLFIGIGLLSISMSILLSLLYLFGQMETGWMIVYELVLFVLAQTVLLVRRSVRAFAEVERLSKRLLTLDGLKDEFMANTSHELRTPLHGIINIARSMLEGAAGPASFKQKENLAMIMAVGQRLSLLVGDILDFSKMKEGRLRLDARPLNLASVVRSVVEVIGYTLDGKPIAIVQDLPDDLPSVKMDEDRLRQILYNLLGNAVKYTREGEIRIGASELGGTITVRVSDTGVGIERHRWPDIFRRFERVTDERNAAGAGLGLSITKELVELAGGRIWLESEPGAGSCFFFTLPASEEASLPPAAFKEADAAEETPEADMPLAPSGSGRVLIVDDDPINRRVLLNLLTTAGYDTSAVSGGEEALAFMESGAGVELVITDWMMPGMSGIELCRRLRERRSLAELPILLLTARVLPEDIRAGFDAGASDFLGKPVDAGELRARARTLIATRRAAEEAVRTEMAFLQAQIKPHFLYNALNVIISTCPVDPDKATELLIELSHYLRGSFDFHNRERLVPLSKELDLVHAYIALEQARFEDRLQFQCEVDDLLGEFVPPLSIQPLVENAVRHGIMRRSSGGTVRLEIRDLGSSVSVVVADDGVGMGAAEFEEIMAGRQGGVGLRNIQQRLLAQYGASLKLGDRSGGEGTLIAFELPKAAGL